MDPPRIFVSLQALRGLAALMVVLFHLRIVEEKYGGGLILLPQDVRFFDAGVDLFFVISGFVMSTLATGLYGSPRNATTFLLRRAWRVFPPYWFYTSLVVVLMLLAPSMVNTSYQGQSILASYLLWPQASLPVLTVGWTLIHEIFFYLVFALAIAFLRSALMPWFLLAWALLTAVLYSTTPSTPPWLALISSPMTFEFIAGALIGRYWRSLPGAWALGTLLVGVTTLICVMLLQGPNAIGEQPLPRVLSFGPPAVLIVWGAVRWEQHREFSIPRWLRAIGDSSYSLYLSHVFVISAAGRLWQASGHHTGLIQHLIFIAATLLACVLVGWLSYRGLERPLHTWGTRFFKRGFSNARLPYPNPPDAHPR